MTGAHPNIDKDFFKSRFVAFVLLLTVTLYAMTFTSCGLVAPKPFDNKTAQPPTAILYREINFEIGDTVNGTKQLVFHPDSSLKQVKMVKLFVDSSYAASVNSPPYSFSLKTDLWPNGKHLISFGVYETGSHIGLLNAVQAPTIEYYDTVVFMHPPLPPKNVTVVYADGHPNISWTETNPGDAAYYIVRRGYPWSDTTNFEVPSTARSFVDSAVNAYIGASVGYYVGAANRLGVSFSSMNMHMYGITSNAITYAGPVIAELDSSVIFDAGTGWVTKLSCQTAQVIDKGGFAVPYSRMSLNLVAATMGFDSSEVYCWGGNPGVINVLDADKLSSMKILHTDPLNTPSSPFGVTSGPQNKLFMIRSNGDLAVINGSTGATLDSTVGFLDGGSTFIGMSPGGHTMLAIDGIFLDRFSVNSDNPSIAGQKYIGGNTAAWRILWNKSEVAICLANPTAGASNAGVTVWNYENFSKRQITPPSGAVQIGMVAASNDYLYVPYLVQMNGSEYTLLVQYDINTLAQTRQWIIASRISSMMLSKAGRYIFIETSWRGFFLINLEGNSL